MKKSLFCSMIFLIGLATVGCGDLQKTKENLTEKNVTGDEKAGTLEITEEQAKNIALNDAQVSVAEMKKIRIEKDEENGKLVYDITFMVENREYDYEIDVYTGEIINKDWDIDND